MLLQVVTLVLLWTVCAANEDSTQTRGSEARYHIRGPKHQEAVVGGGSSITCSVAAPEEDDTFMMEINGNGWDELEGVWTEAEFSKAVYDYENGTIETRIEGFVESFTKEHDMADIRCYSLKHKGEVSMTIKLQDSLTLTADGTRFEYPWQDVPLELWTSSVVGSDDEIHFEAFETGSSDAHIITRMVIRFSRIPIIYVGRCISDTPLENFPYSNQQVWRFVKNGYQDLTVFCNGVQVAYLNFHEAPDPACSYNLGELEARYIKFNARWDHTDRVAGICEAPLPYQGVAAVRQPPVLNGEEIPLACPEGKTLHGTDRVRCYSPEIHSGETYHFEGDRPVCFSEPDVRYHIRGPGRHGEAVIGTGSSITCSVAAPEEDDTFEMEVNGWHFSDIHDSVWTEAGFSRSVYRYENGTIETRIEGFVESFTKEHDMADIRCYSRKYEGEVSMTIKTQGWLPVEREVEIEWDLESTPLEIKTNSVLGSNDRVGVFFYSAEGENAGTVWLFLGSTPQYYIGYCSTSFTNLPVNPPSATDKVWRITLTRTAGVRLVIHCNEVEVVNTLISESTCEMSWWSMFWNKDVTKIKFDSEDTASDYYGPQPEPDVRYHIRGPGRHGEAVIGTGSSITCSVAAPEEDETFGMEVNGWHFSDIHDSVWTEAGFSRSVYRYENGTIETRIEGLVESFTKEHDMAAIKCYSNKYEGEVSMTIKIQEPDVRYHIRGPGRHGEAVIGSGSSITCSVAAPEEDDTFMLEINGNNWNSDSFEGAWTEAGFARSVYQHRNGTISTAIEGFVESFTEEHDMADIRCYSKKYEGEVSMTIKLQERKEVNLHFGGVKMTLNLPEFDWTWPFGI